MMKQRSHLLTLFVSALMTGSCDPVAIDETLPDGSAKLCINSYFMADSTIRVYISKGKYILNDVSYVRHEPVNGATVAISGENRSPTTLLPAVFSTAAPTDGWYESSFTLPAGETSHVTVSAAGMESVSASCYIPRPVPVLKAELVAVEPPWGNYIVDVYFNDPPETKNYYRIISKISVERAMQNHELAVLTDDPLFSFNPEPFSPTGKQFSRPVLFSDDGLNGNPVKVRCKMPRVVYDMRLKHTLKIELQSLSREYYLHKTSEELQHATDGDPFAQPAPVYSNVKNGFGIFAAASSSTIILEW